METEIILMRCNNKHAGFSMKTAEELFPADVMKDLKAGIVITSTFKGLPAELEYIKDIGSCLVYQLMGKIPIL